MPDRDVELRLSGRAALLAQRAADLSPLLRAVGFHLVGAAQRTFRDQVGPHGERWPPRRVPNVSGIVEDLRKGGQPKARRFEAAPALIDTGRLRGSISFRAVGRDTVQVGTTSRYARAHQDGGLTEPRLGAARQGGDPILRRNLTLFMRTAKGKELRPQLGWLFSTASFQPRVPARPFLGVSPASDRWINLAIGAWVRGDPLPSPASVGA